MRSKATSATKARLLLLLLRNKSPPAAEPAPQRGAQGLLRLQDKSAASAGKATLMGLLLLRVLELTGATILQLKSASARALPLLAHVLGLLGGRLLRLEAATAAAISMAESALCSILAIAQLPLPAFLIRHRARPPVKIE